MDTITMLGLVAGSLTTVSFLPQVLKAWKTKSTKDLSFVMCLLLCAGILLWIVYGFLINSMPVIIANSVSFVLTSIMLVLKIVHNSRKLP